MPRVRVVVGHRDLGEQQLAVVEPQGSVAQVDHAVLHVEQVRVRVELDSLASQSPTDYRGDPPHPRRAEQGGEPLATLVVRPRAHLLGTEVDQRQPDGLGDDWLLDLPPHPAVVAHPVERAGVQKPCAQRGIGDVLSNVGVLQAPQRGARWRVLLLAAVVVVHDFSLLLLGLWHRTRGLAPAPQPGPDAGPGAHHPVLGGQAVGLGSGL